MESNDTGRSRLPLLLAWLAISLGLADISLTAKLVLAVRAGTLAPALIVSNLGSPAAWEYVITWVVIGFTSIFIQRAGDKIHLEGTGLLVAFAWAMLNYTAPPGTYRPSMLYTVLYFIFLLGTIFVAAYSLYVKQTAAEQSY